MQLRYISVAALIAEAGGDPWAINHSLQAGSPFQIAQLAEAFLKAGRCTAEATDAFDQARSRFDAAWNHQNGDHPINGSAEVQRVTKSLGAQSLQLPKIGADLENIAATLAEAQKTPAGQIAALESRLQQLDGFIGQAVEMEKDPTLTAEDRHALDAFIGGREDDAIRDTKAALGQLQSTRNGYSNSFQNAMGTLHADGYDLTAPQAGPDQGPAEQPGGGPALAPTKGEVLTGASGAIAGGTADGVRGATTTLIAASPGTGPGKADPGLLRWLEDAKIGGVEMPGFSRIGGVVGAASAIPAVMSDIKDGNSVPEAITRETAGVAAGLWAGAEFGAAVGSIVPGAGTAVGLVAGAVVGAGFAFAASKTVEVAWEPAADAVGSVVHGVESIFGFG
ncbi:hypothetical protein [Mycobacterium sp. 852002-10029_SCH5224772]|uniref:putative alpha/beta hydrolase n=1 Tax=Mycobacterium sp. 852002-10029_SCH5224772 TaxID=1834083 RepID=UPI0007FD162D|nr:hypothetical protein [Mycobacterium sp. 852002-10029_SCH5224772]OBE95104.1 hypothetical protein A5775_11310 [Mycobacterium sp. 852002-10029_SCH5224772]